VSSHTRQMDKWEACLVQHSDHFVHIRLGNIGSCPFRGLETAFDPTSSNMNRFFVREIGPQNKDFIVFTIVEALGRIRMCQNVSRREELVLIVHFAFGLIQGWGYERLLLTALPFNCVCELRGQARLE